MLDTIRLFLFFRSVGRSATSRSRFASFGFANADSPARIRMSQCSIQSSRASLPLETAGAFPCYWIDSRLAGESIHSSMGVARDIIGPMLAGSGRGIGDAWEIVGPSLAGFELMTMMTSSYLLVSLTGKGAPMGGSTVGVDNTITSWAWDSGATTDVVSVWLASTSWLLVRLFFEIREGPAPAVGLFSTANHRISSVDGHPITVNKRQQRLSHRFEIKQKRKKERATLCHTYDGCQTKSDIKKSLLHQ